MCTYNPFYAAVCDSYNCGYGGVCEVEGGNATCRCRIGYSGPTCEHCKQTVFNYYKLFSS